MTVSNAFLVMVCICGCVSILITRNDVVYVCPRNSTVFLHHVNKCVCVCVCVHSVECLYQSTSHLEVHCQPGVLIPDQKREVDFLFYPREARYYHEVIPFEINGLSTMQVKIHGEGTDMKVGLPVFLLVFC